MWYRQSALLPACKDESLETRIVNIHVFIYRLWCFTETSWHIFLFFVTFRSLAVVQNLGISTRGWLVFNCVFRFGEHKCTQFLSGLKTVFFSSVLHPYDIWHHSWVKKQVRTRKLTYARSPIVCVRYVGDYEVSLNDRGTTGSTFEVPSFELLLFLPPWYYQLLSIACLPSKFLC